MRALQLLAIAMVCPLVGLCSACARIEQSLGQFEGAAGLSIGASSASSASVVAGTDGTRLDAGANSVPPSPMDGSSLDAAAPALPTFPALSYDDGGTSMACEAASFMLLQRKRLDIYIVVDANITLPYTGLWEYVTAGLRAFVQDPATQGTGVGLRFFGTQCDPSIYDSQPTVEVGTLPGNLDALVRATNEDVSFNASPMAPALQGGISHQLKRANADLGSRQIVVLATDGFTQDFTCSYSPTDLEDIAATGLHAAQSIATYIVAFGVPDTMIPIADNILSRFSPLGPIAAAGGTDDAIKLNYGTDPETMHSALTSVRRSAQPCEYAVPIGTDIDHSNLVFAANGWVPRVADATQCGSEPGFYYDSAAAPQWLTLCEKSCAPLQRQDDSAFMLKGCETLMR